MGASRTPLGVVLGLCLSSVPVMANVGEDIDALTQRWLDVERQRAAIQANWVEQQRIGDLQLNLLRAEKSSLQTFVNSMSASEDEVDAQRRTLVDEQQTLEQRDQLIAQQLGGLLARMQQLQPRLPPPVAEVAAQKLPQALDTEQSLSERLAALLGLMSEIAEFDRRIALHQTRMTLGGRLMQVQQIYLGVSRGWYISTDDQWVGAGYAQDTGWHWEDHSDNPAFDKASVRLAIEQVEAGSSRELVTLPISLGARQ